MSMFNRKPAAVGGRTRKAQQKRDAELRALNILFDCEGCGRPTVRTIQHINLCTHCIRKGG